MRLAQPPPQVHTTPHGPSPGLHNGHCPSHQKMQQWPTGTVYHKEHFPHSVSGTILSMGTPKAQQGQSSIGAPIPRRQLAPEDSTCSHHEDENKVSQSIPLPAKHTPPKSGRASRSSGQNTPPRKKHHILGPSKECRSTPKTSVWEAPCTAQLRTCGKSSLREESVTTAQGES